MADQCVGKVYKTSDHKKFKHLEGNREVTALRARKIKTSIEKNGYIFNPIIVNEKFEIIDGGGRQQVLEEMGLPVDYIIRPGMTVKDCQALNTAGSSWKNIDYINSYADLGNMNYVYLRNLIIRFPEIPVNPIIAAVADMVCAPSQLVNAGELKCSETDYNRAGEALSYVNRFIPIIKRCKTKARANLMIGALLFAKKTECDHERLYRQFDKLYPTDLIPDMQNMESVLRGLSTIYNYQSRVRRIYFETEYKNYQSEKNCTYAARWNKEAI